MSRRGLAAGSESYSSANGKEQSFQVKGKSIRRKKLSKNGPDSPPPVYIHGKPLANKEYVMFTKGWETQVLRLQIVDCDVGTALSTTSGLPT